MKPIPYITEEWFELVRKNFLEAEENDLGPSETILGESCFQSSSKEVFWHIIFLHCPYFFKNQEFTESTPEGDQIERLLRKPEYVVDVKELLILLKKTTHGLSSWNYAEANRIIDEVNHIFSV